MTLEQWRVEQHAAFEKLADDIARMPAEELTVDFLAMHLQWTTGLLRKLIDLLAAEKTARLELLARINRNEAN